MAPKTRVRTLAFIRPRRCSGVSDCRRLALMTLVLASAACQMRKLSMQVATTRGVGPAASGSSNVPADPTARAVT
jgi:hypothetical protein